MSKKAIFIPIITAFLTLFFYYMYNVRLETTLPDEGWGRSTNLEATSQYPMEYYSYIQGEQLHVYMPGDGHVSYKVFDKSFKKIKEESIQANVAPAEPIWAKEQQIIYMENHQLVNNQDGKIEIIEKEITSFTPIENGVLYWNGKELKEYSASTDTTKTIHTYDQPIYKAVQAKNGNSMLVALEISDLEIHYYLWQNGDAKKLLEYSATGSETIENLVFDAGEQKATAIISKYTMAQGQRAYHATELRIDLETSKIEKNENYAFYDESNGMELDNPRYLQVTYQDENPTVLFVAEGNRVAKRSGYNVYYASQKEGMWIAERRSNTADSSARPQWIDQNYITWQTIKGKEYVLHGTTNHEKYIDSSKEINRGDYLSAFYYFISGLFSGFFMLVMGMVWVIPPLVLYGVLSYVKEDIFERNDRTWLEPVGILLYLGTMIYMLNQVLSDKSFSQAPSYLNFDGGLIVWPIIIGGLTYIIYRWVMGKDTGLFAGLFYYMGYNLLVMTCLFGPYLL